MAISQPEGTFEEQIIWLTEHLTLSKIQFFFAFLISPALIYLMIAQFKQFENTDSILSKLGFICLACYLVLNSIAYASQMILVPAFIKASMNQQLQVWYMGAPESVIYFLNQMGYFFWAAGALLLFSASILKTGIIRLISFIYAISALLSIIAFAGLVFESNLMNSMTVISGMVLIPVGILTIIWGIRIKKETIHE